MSKSQARIYRNRCGLQNTNALFAANAYYLFSLVQPEEAIGDGHGIYYVPELSLVTSTSTTNASSVFSMICFQGRSSSPRIFICSPDAENEFAATRKLLNMTNEMMAEQLAWFVCTPGRQMQRHGGGFWCEASHSKT